MEENKTTNSNFKQKNKINYVIIFVLIIVILILLAKSNSNKSDQTQTKEIPQQFNTINTKIKQPASKSQDSQNIIPVSIPISQQPSKSNTEISKTWHAVTTYSNDIKTQTPPFSMKGSEWRITYACTPTDSINGFSGSINDVDDGLVANNFASIVKCPTNNTTYVYAQKPGKYYLDLDSVNANYNITIEENY